MTPLFLTLKKPLYLFLTLILTILFCALYILFDLRQGGIHLTIFSVHLMPFQYFWGRFGGLYVVSRIVLDLLIAFLSALLIAVTLDNYRNGSALLTGSACSTGATVLLGIATFGCPSCVLPIAGTVGAIFTSQALPFFGFEFKILSLVIILGTFVWFLRRLRQAERVTIALQEQKFEHA